MCARGSHPESVQDPAYLLLLSEPQFPHLNKTKTKANVPVLRILGFLEGKQLVQGGVSSFPGFAVPPQGPEAPGNVLEWSHSSQVDRRLPSLHPSRQASLGAGLPQVAIQEGPGSLPRAFACILSFQPSSTL